jgi:hypothetical protein
MPPTWIPVTLNMVKVKATFNPTLINSTTANPLATDIEPEGLEIDPGLTMIVMELVTDPPPPSGIAPAVFQTNPIQWFDADNAAAPALDPGMYIIQRIGNHHLTLLDFNSNFSSVGENMNHRFNLIVSYNGSTYGGDPMIINEPPVPVVPDGDRPARRSRTGSRAHKR